MAQQAIFCFIDDARFELENFRVNAAPGFNGVEFVYASSFKEASDCLRGRLPVCFLLDIYGSPGGPGKARLPDPADLARMIEPAPAVELFYQGVDASDPEGGNLFLRRVYGGLSKWQRAFAHACQGLRQDRQYGLGNLAMVRREYPWAAALGYSRKAFYSDASAMTLAGADGVLQKPQGDDETAIAQATWEAAPDLARAAFRAVDKRLGQESLKLGLSLGAMGHEEQGLARALLMAGKLLLIGRQGDNARQMAEAGSALEKAVAGDMELGPAKKDAVMAAAGWLQTGFGK